MSALTDPENDPVFEIVGEAPVEDENFDPDLEDESDRRAE